MRPLGVEIAAMLAARGVDTIFGIPGVHNIELYRGIDDAGIRHVLARHEQGAGFMADGYARATNKPGVCFVISGPGLTNIMTPMGQAYSDSVPMLVISTVLDETAAKRGQLHQMRDQEGAARTVCDWSETAQSPEAAYTLIDRAFAEFETIRQRPKHIQIPVSVMGALAPPPPAPRSHHIGGKLAPNPSDLTRVTAHLKTARKPLFIFGGGAKRIPQKQITDVLARTKAASFVTYAGRGIVRADTPRFLGAHLAHSGAESLIGEADLIVAVGTELAPTDRWRANRGAKAAIVRVDIDPEMLGQCTGQDLAIRADADLFLRGLNAELSQNENAGGWDAKALADTRTRWSRDVATARPGIVPASDALRAALPQNLRIYSDMTQFAYAAKEIWDMQAAGLWHHPVGFGTLGYALPAAIGCAVTGGATLAIAGDYGFQYTMQELGTAAELGLSLPILIWDNQALGEIRDNMVEAQIAPNAVHALNPDWENLATAYRCAYAAPTTTKALCEATLEALNAGRPTVIVATPEISSSS
ncbi:thiamine pyrophosphate-binding protein [Boseongicola aestuarii]|uniref:Putative 2-ketoarginine decarboxylase AruI n=1 Tax=Boseongicola aestuarii TaxID=1470561 RepID=A0A238J2B7_9RHOB|nr:thiamine pyrophosphate-binding protein [Boseongicola aestuarii]SMX24848.1 putative 2-ketoarginine decarboxylase AruI [Boseongicola aestuarii]